MANFPASLDTLTNPTATDYLNSPSHAGQHANANDILEALEAKVGINSSAVTTSHDYKIATLETGWVLVGDSWAYASADAPTFTITVPSGAASKYSVGMRIKLTQTTVKYFIITAVADTVLTVYGGTDYTLVNAAISAISYSTQKAPLGFPLSPLKWQIETVNSTDIQQSSAVTNQWYNLGSLSIAIPIGLWDVQYFANFGGSAGSTVLDMNLTLSTANNSESDVEMTGLFKLDYTGTSAILRGRTFINRRKTILIASKETRYLNGKSQVASNAGNLFLSGTQGSTVIRAVCAYL